MDRESGDPLDPRRAYSVEVSGVGGSRNRSGLAAGVALVAVAALLIGGILAGQLFPVQQAAVAPLAQVTPQALSSPPAPPPDSPIAPVPTGPLTARTTADALDVAALIASIPMHGTGPLAFVSGHLSTRPRPCGVGAPLSACRTIRIDGLRGAAVVPDDTMGSWPGDPVPGETLVLLPRDGRLVFLGALVIDPAGIPRADVLAARLAAAPMTAHMTLAEADGILVRGTAPCIWQDRCAPGAPTLLVVPPSGGWTMSFTGAQSVVVADGAFGIRASATWTTGPFLVRIRAEAADEPAWQVVALEDQSSILHVIIP
jgi:hypothetical protein